MTTPLEDIEQATKNYADARDLLSTRITVLENEIEQLKRKYLKGIRAAVRAVSDRHSKLYELIDDNQDLFVKPRTKVISGVKVGIAKGKGSFVIIDNDKTCNLIAKKIPEEFDTLVKQTQTVVKGALSNLTATQLKTVGISISQAGDQIVIKPTDSHVDKLVNALLKEAEKIEQGSVDSAAQ